MPTGWERLRWSLWAPLYDPVVRRAVRGRRRAIAQLDLQGDERILISGCGTGLDLELLPPSTRIVAVDYNESMVRATRRRAQRLGRDVDVRVMDAASLELDDETFDVVLLHLVLAVVRDPVAVASEARRVLRGSGRISIYDKFLPEDRKPSLPRRLLNVATRVLATDINRRLHPILHEARLEVVKEESSLLGGFFRVAVARKS